MFTQLASSSVLLQPTETRDRKEQSARKMLYLETRIFTAEDRSEGTVGHSAQWFQNYSELMEAHVSSVR